MARGVYARPVLADRFWARTDRSGGPDACWEWRGYRMPGGYGNLSIDDRTQLTHRVAWQLTNGPIPDDLWVLHRCDNRPCCNPAHLFLGTTQDNSADRKAKGRNPDKRGAKHHLTRLDDPAVLRIREIWSAGGRTQQSIASEFAISQPAVSEIVNRRKWAHL